VTYDLDLRTYEVDLVRPKLNHVVKYLLQMPVYSKVIVGTHTQDRLHYLDHTVLSKIDSKASFSVAYQNLTGRV